MELFHLVDKNIFIMLITTFPIHESSGGNFSLINALGQYDGQWYLKIAESRISDHPTSFLNEHEKVMGELLYNFFPLYPVSIRFSKFFY